MTRAWPRNSPSRYREMLSKLPGQAWIAIPARRFGRQGCRCRRARARERRGAPNRGARMRPRGSRSHWPSPHGLMSDHGDGPIQ